MKFIGQEFNGRFWLSVASFDTLDELTLWVSEGKTVKQWDRFAINRRSFLRYHELYSRSRHTA